MEIAFPFAGLGVLCFPFICMTPVVFVLFSGMWWYSNRDKRTIEVTAVATERRYSENGTYDIWTVIHADGREEMLFNGPNLFNWKFMGQTVRIKRMFEENAKYRLRVAGGKRFSDVGLFQNILHAEKIG